MTSYPGNAISHLQGKNTPKYPEVNKRTLQISSKLYFKFNMIVVIVLFEHLTY